MRAKRQELRELQGAGRGEGDDQKQSFEHPFQSKRRKAETNSTRDNPNDLNREGPPTRKLWTAFIGASKAPKVSRDGGSLHMLPILTDRIVLQTQS